MQYRAPFMISITGGFIVTVLFGFWIMGIEINEKDSARSALMSPIPKNLSWKPIRNIVDITSRSNPKRKTLNTIKIEKIRNITPTRG